jgi:hypothetical protein
LSHSKIKQSALDHVRQFVFELPEVKSRRSNKLEADCKMLEQRRNKARDVVLSSLGKGATLALCNEQHPAAIGYDAARHALGKLFEKKRPQVVNVWITDTTESLLETLDQRGQKYDRLRSKYMNAYVDLLTKVHAEKTLRSLCLWMMASINASGDKGCGGSVVSVSLVHALTARNSIVISRRKALHLKLQAAPQTTALQASIFASMEEAYDCYLMCHERQIRHMAARCGLKVSFQTQLLHLFQMAADTQHNVHINDVIEFCHGKWESKMGRSKIAKASIGRKQKIPLQLSA